MSRSRPRDANLRAVGHLKHELIRIAVIGDVSDASPISSGRALLTLRPLRALRPLRSLWAFRTDKVHEQGPRPIVIPKQVPCARVQIHITGLPIARRRIGRATQESHASTTSTAASNRERIARRNMGHLPVGTQKFEQAILAHSFSPPLRLAPLRPRSRGDEGGVALDASSAALCSASLRLRRLNPVSPMTYATLCLKATMRMALGSYTLCQLSGSASSALVGNAPETLASVHFTPRGCRMKTRRLMR